jgi:hypothetical protein
MTTAEIRGFFDRIRKKWPPEEFDLTIIGPRTDGGYVVTIRRTRSFADIHRLEASSYRGVLLKALGASGGYDRA